MSQPQPGHRRLLALCVGFTLWFFILCAIYAAHAFGCAVGWNTTVMRIGLSLAALISLAPLVLWILRRADALQDENDFLPRTIRLATWASVAATIAVLLPPMLLTACK